MQHGDEISGFTNSHARHAELLALPEDQLAMKPAGGLPGDRRPAGYSDGILRITAPARNPIPGSPGALEVTVQPPARSRVEARAANAQFTTAGQLCDVTFDSA